MASAWKVARASRGLRPRLRHMPPPPLLRICARRPVLEPRHVRRRRRQSPVRQPLQSGTEIDVEVEDFDYRVQGTWKQSSCGLRQPGPSRFHALAASGRREGEKACAITHATEETEKD